MLININKYKNRTENNYGCNNNNNNNRITIWFGYE